MSNNRFITDDVAYIGASDNRLRLFENLFPLPHGVSYNSYVILDNECALIDTVDESVSEEFFNNLNRALGGRSLDYVIVNHMEPDHSATLMKTLSLYPEATLLLNQKTLVLVEQFFNTKFNRVKIVKDGETLSLGTHKLQFVFAPMVHWPEVMFTYDATAKILFSADAFGSFGSISNIMDNESGYCEEYIQEMRRYYTNIVGKYGIQVKMALCKASALDIKYICPLHGLVLCSHIGEVITKYLLWAEYKAEDNDGVLVVYASMYGHTKALAYSVATTLAERGVATQVYDVSETDVSYLIAESFKFRKIALLSVTYNNRLYPKMKQFLDDFVALNNQNKVFALAENGSWAPCAIKEMKEIIALAKNCSINSETITIKSSPTDKTELDITNFVEAIIKA